MVKHRCQSTGWASLLQACMLSSAVLYIRHLHPHVPIPTSWWRCETCCLLSTQLYANHLSLVSTHSHCSLTYKFKFKVLSVIWVGQFVSLFILVSNGNHIQDHERRRYAKVQGNPKVLRTFHLLQFLDNDTRYLEQKSIDSWPTVICVSLTMPRKYHLEQPEYPRV